jgi:glycosyltransferase involved in cell wall biosynthesis
MTGRNPSTSSSKIPIALDLSCILDPPLTGVGYAALYQVQALRKFVDCFDYRLFGARSRRGSASVPELAGIVSSECILSYVRRVKPAIWTRVNFPPIEWFCGEVRLAHDFFHQLPAARTALRCVTIHDLSFIRHPETHTRQTVQSQTRLVRHAVKHADALVAVSEFCKRELLELAGADERKIHVVPNGVNVDDFVAPLAESAIAAVKETYGINGDHIIYLGTIEGRKNIALLLDAYATFSARNKSAPLLVLAGKVGWRSEAILEAINRFGPSGGVLQLGHIPRHDAIVLLRSARACVYPSIYEGFGLPALEAMAAGVPLIVSDADALIEVAGETATTFPRNDVDALVDALRRVVDDREESMRLAALAKQRAAHMTWLCSAATLVRVWLGLLGEQAIDLQS